MMMQTSSLFRRMAWLALMAALLAVSAPTVSRVLAATVAKAMPILTDMCTTAGAQRMDVSTHGAGAEAPAHPRAGLDQVCGYCVLVTPLPVALLLLGMLALRPPNAPVARRYAAIFRLPRNLRGLGAQAPPVAF